MGSRKRDGEELWGLGRPEGSATGQSWYSLDHISPASDGAEKDAGRDSWGLRGSFCGEDRAGLA